MAGLVHVKKCLSEPKHVIKLIVIVLCCCATIYQLSGCLDKILNPPISTTYKFTLNETIQYPALTICRRPAYKVNLFPLYNMKNNTLTSFERQFLTFPFNTTTVRDFLEKTTYPLTEIAPLYSFQGKGFGTNNIQVDHRYFVKKGRCSTLIPKENSKTFSIGGGYFFYLKHDAYIKNDLNIHEQSGTGFEIYIHSANEVLNGDNEEITSYMEYVYLETSEDLILNLRLQTFTQVSSKTNECEPNPDYSKSKCEEECYHKKIVEIVGCTLPWIRYAPENVSECNTYESVFEMLKALNELTRTTLIRNCECKNSCTNSIYNVQVIRRADTYDYVKPGSTLNVYYPSNLMTEMAETCGYDWNMFLSDIGGSMGFLLGLSVIGFITIIESSIHLFFSDKKNDNVGIKDEKVQAFTMEKGNHPPEYAAKY